MFRRKKEDIPIPAANESAALDSIRERIKAVETQLQQLNCDHPITELTKGSYSPSWYLKCSSCDKLLKFFYTVKDVQQAKLDILKNKAKNIAKEINTMKADIEG